MRFAAGQRLLFLAFLTLVGTIALGGGDAMALERAEISTSLNPDGSGSMITNSQTNPSDEVWSWEACEPDLSSCAPFATGRIVSTDGAAAETVFRVTSSLGATALSPVWHGNVAATGLPSVAGTVRANELVSPVAGQWSGGWDGGGDLFQLAACMTLSGTGCTTLTHSNYPRQCPGTAVVLDPFFTGRYLRVADWRLGAGPYVMPLYAVVTPYGHRGWEPRPTVSAAVVGRIAPATRDRAASCGPPPLVEAAISRRGIATVTCGLGCRIVLIARRGTRSVRLVREVARPTPGRLRGPIALGIPRPKLDRLDPGRVRIVVKVNGVRAARRTTLLD